MPTLRRVYHRSAKTFKKIINSLLDLINIEYKAFSKTNRHSHWRFYLSPKLCLDIGQGRLLSGSNVYDKSEIKI